MNKIKILHTSDIHGNMFLTDYISDLRYGFIKAAKYIRKIKEENGIYIDGGDLIQGSALSYYLTTIECKENPLIGIMKDLNADVLTFGNHEFNFGLEYLKKAVNTYHYCCANIKTNLFKTMPYKIIEKNGMKIAIISLVTSYIPNWEDEKNIKGIEFLDVVETYKKYEKELVDNSDLIIVNYHGGLEYDPENFEKLTEKPIKENEGGILLKKFSSIDVLLTGHQHRKIATKINNTIVMQPVNHSKYISEITIDTSSKSIVDYSLIDVSKINGFDKVVHDKLIHYHNSTNHFLDRKLTTLEKDCTITDIFSARLNGHPLVKLIHQIQLSYSNADISQTSLFDSAIGFKKDVTLRQVYANYPYPNTLKVIEIKKEDLKLAIEKSYEYFIDNNTINEKYIFPKPQHYNFDMFYGENFKYEIDLTKAVGKRVKFLSELADKITIVMSNYRFTNTEIFPMYKNANLIKEIDFDTVTLFTKYFTENKNIKIDDDMNYKIIY